MKLRLRNRPRLATPVVAVLGGLLLFVCILLFKATLSPLPPFSETVALPSILDLQGLLETKDEIALFSSLSSKDLLFLISSYVKGEDAFKLHIVLKASRHRKELIEQLEPSSQTGQLMLTLLSRHSIASFETQILRSLLPQDQEKLKADMSMDSESLWKDIPPTVLAQLEALGDHPLGKHRSSCNSTFMPDHRGKYGGFTADIGWILVSAMYAMETGQCFAFPPKWGHGCAATTTMEDGWTCMFLPIHSPTLTAPLVPLLSSDQATRRRVRRDELYTPALQNRHRYPELSNILKKQGFELSPTADLLAFRLIFRWTFRLNADAQTRVRQLQADILQGEDPTVMAGAHLRFGDKLGLKPGPREAYMVYQVQDFAHRLSLYYQGRPFPRTLFVATDDYNASQELAKLLGPSVRVLTSAKPSTSTGFSIVEYRTKLSVQDRYLASIRLWADMDILARTDVFLGSFQSNVGRTVHLMRFGKPANSTISVDPTGPRCAKRNRQNQLASHNFWYCP